ncbi:MAG: hypothetical protein H5U04_10430 [Firmicutes bacterium]|nr:hypothetical protein [Bacillota bacterium]
MRGRRPWTPGCTVVLVLVALCAGVLAAGGPVRVVHYEHRVIWQAPWGKEPGQVGWAEGKDGNRYGPRAFALRPGGGVLLLDTFNSRVLVLDAQGRVAGTIPLDSTGYDDVAISPSGTIYLAENVKGEVVWLHDAAGVAGREVMRPEGMDVYLIEELAVAEKSVFVQEAGWTTSGFFRRVTYLKGRGEPRGTLASVLVSVSGVREESEGVVSEAVRGTVVAPDGCLYLDVHSPDGFARRVQILSPRLEPWGQVELRTGTFMGQGSLVGVDGRGGMYYLLDGGESTGLYRFDRNGQLAGVLDIPTSGPVRLKKFVRVSPRGDVYFLRAGEESLSLEAYVLRHLWRWRWRR